jgi:hypothetical protein
MIHRCIDQLAEKATTGVAPLCRVLGVSRSGYYAAAARARKPPWFARQRFIYKPLSRPPGEAMAAGACSRPCFNKGGPSAATVSDR